MVHRVVLLVGVLLVVLLPGVASAAVAPASPSQLLPPATTTPAATSSVGPTTAVAPAPTTPTTPAPSSTPAGPTEASSTSSTTGWVVVGGVLVLAVVGLVATAHRRRGQADRSPPPAEVADPEEAPAVRERPVPDGVGRAVDRSEPGTVLTRRPTPQAAVTDGPTTPARLALPPPGPVSRPARPAPVVTPVDPDVEPAEPAPAAPPVPPAPVVRAVVRAAPKPGRPLSKRKGRR